MYLVVNQTKKSVILNDLKVEIPAGSMMDLDKFKGNKVLNAADSEDLKHACRSGILKTMKKDKPNQVVVAENQKNQRADILSDIKQLIRDELKGANTDSPEPTLPPPPTSESTTEPAPTQQNREMAQMLAMMKNMQDMMASGAMHKTSQDKVDHEYVSEIDEEKLLEIHSAAMKKMKENSQTQSEISYDINTVEDSNISDNLKDLEDII